MYACTLMKELSRRTLSVSDVSQIYRPPETNVGHCTQHNTVEYSRRTKGKDTSSSTSVHMYTSTNQ